jgi:hypothetical protein
MGGTGGIGALNDNQAYPLSRMDKTQYAVPRQLPTSAEVISADYDPKIDVFTGMPDRFAKGGEVEGNVDVSFGYPNSAYMDPAYGYAHDPVHNAMMQARSEGVLNRYQSGNRGELSPEEEEAVKIRAMVMAGNPKYDPRYMPLRLDDRPLSPIQAAMMRLQAEKQIGEGNARAGISALAAALPNRQGVTALPGAYDVGYNTPVGPGNLDVSAYRAMRGMPDGKVPYGVNARYSVPFSEGGEIDPIARMEEMNRPQAWNPESGQVKLQQPADPKDPFGEMKTIDYTVPKDQIKTFIPNMNQETGLPNGSGAYVLKDGSTLGVDNFGVVSAATPGRNDYTLNKDGYYQPTGANLTWDGGANMLTKKIGGVDVQVPNVYHKGGYQNPDGSLRVNEEGVPVPLLPNYLDSGVGKSGLADAAPYIAIAAITAATMGASAPASAGMLGGEAAFAGMVPASETLLGSMGYLGSAAAPTVAGAETLGSTVAPTLTSTAPSAGGITALDAGTKAAISSAAAPTYTTASLPYGITSVAPATSSTMLPGAAALQVGGTGLGGAAAADIAAKASTMTPMQKLAVASLATKALSSGSGGSSSAGPSATTTTTQAPPQPNISSSTYNPAFTMPNMFNAPQAAPGSYYQPTMYRYAQGGVADLGGYAAGGKLLKGPGDGMSDSIVANIAGKQPARLADGEFVVPADVVSHLGNGSTDAGAKHLYKMMDRIRQARTGNSKQGKRINPNKFLPKG